RLHTTDSIIARIEGRLPSMNQIALSELERKALLDADRVVAHLRPVAQACQQLYGFGPDWLERVTVEFPPITVEPTAAMAPRVQRDLVFATKIQRCKRPDLFVRGAALFMRSQPEFGGRALFACHAFEQPYWESIQALI